MANKKVVFTNGVFDLLHPGHLNLLNYAKSLGHYLVVAIDSDQKVYQDKNKRPVFNAAFRRNMLLATKYVDEVVIFDTNEQLANYVKSFKADVLVKGPDYKGKKLVGEEFAKYTAIYPGTKDLSTSLFLQNIGRKIIAIDFDKTLVNGYHYTKLENVSVNEELRQKVNAWRLFGHYIVIYTSRPAVAAPEVEFILKANNVLYDHIEFGKVNYDVLIDDKVINIEDKDKWLTL